MAEVPTPTPEPWDWAGTPPEPPPIRWLPRVERWAHARRPDGTDPGLPAKIVRFGLLFGRWVAAALSFVLFSLVAVVGVLIPWAVQRLVVIDPLGSGRRRRSRWVPRRASADHPTHPWTTDPAWRPPRPFRRVRVAVAAAVVVLGAMVWVSQREPELRAASIARAPVPAAYAGVGWWPQYKQEMAFLTDNAVWNPYDWQHVADVDMQYFDVVDGRRETWQPPDCDCPTVTLWMYGGSTTFGLGQRDEHTIASELARAAWEDGVRLVVDNVGVPGDLHWEEARRFALDVTLEDPPDLVVFYDGVNEIAGTDMRNGAQDNDDPQPISLTLDAFRRDWGQAVDPLGIIGSDGVDAPGGGEVAEDEPTELYDEEGVAQRTIDDYERARLVSRAIADATGVDVAWSWSPSRFTRPVEPSEPQLPPDNEESVRRTWAATIALLPDDVIDLTGALNDVEGPVYYDDVHHDERGARAIAQDLYAALRRRIDAAAEGQR